MSNFALGSCIHLLLTLVLCASESRVLPQVCCMNIGKAFLIAWPLEAVVIKVMCILQIEGVERRFSNHKEEVGAQVPANVNGSGLPNSPFCLGKFLQYLHVVSEHNICIFIDIRLHIGNRFLYVYTVECVLSFWILTVTFANSSNKSLVILMFGCLCLTLID